MNEPQNRPPYQGAYYQPPLATDSGTIQQQMQYQQQMLYYKNKRNKEAGELITAGIAIGGAMIVSLIIQVIAFMFLQKRGLDTLYSESIVFQNCFNIIAVDMLALLLPFGITALIMKPRFVTPIVPHKHISGAQLAAWTGLGLGCCVGANYATDLVMKLCEKIGYKLEMPEMLKPDSLFACFIIIFSTAVAPAICEEFAFRCVSLGVFRKHGKAFAVIAVSIIFGLMHGNAIQFVFAFLIALILGYATIMTDSIVPAILVHGLNNSLSVIQDTVKFLYGDKASEIVLGALFLAMVTAAVIGLLYLLFKKSLYVKDEKKVKEPYALSFGVKLLCILPGMLLPIIILIYATSQYITKV